MNPYDIEQEPMHFNKKGVIGVCACFLVCILILFGAYFGNNSDKPEETSETAEMFITESTTSPEESTSAYETTTPEDTFVSTEDATASTETADVIAPGVTRPQFSAPPAVDTTTPDIVEPEVPNTNYVSLDETEKLIFATLVAYECGGSSYETKLAVASVVVNRMKMWNMSARDVIYATNQFSPAELINKETGENHYWRNGKKRTKDMTRGGSYEECWLAVEEVCTNGPSIPSYVFYFRSGHYHNWSTLVNYAKIGPLYFSYAPKYTKVCNICGDRFTKTEINDHKLECTANN